MGFGCMVTSDAAVIAQAVDMGINFFDTARVYQGGNNERMVGAALKGKRQKLVLSSKTLAPTKDGALAHLDTSLKELQTDYLDIWYLHSKSKPEHITDDLMEAQRIAKQQGKIRFAGISSHVGHRELIPAVIKANHFDVLLASYNFTMGTTIDDLLEQTRKAGIGVVAMKVFAGGYHPIPAVKNDPQVIELLHREGAMFAALKWALKNKHVDTTIPSITDLDQLDEDVRAMASPFTPADEKGALCAARFSAPALLPHVQLVRRDLPAGLARGRRAALPDLRRRVRPVRRGARELPRTFRATAQRALRRLRRMRGQMRRTACMCASAWPAHRSCSPDAELPRHCLLTGRTRGA
jgi:aryl-alcohol dehydrogenase-like predicted oxidoreductase